MQRNLAGFEEKIQFEVLCRLHQVPEFSRRGPKIWAGTLGRPETCCIQIVVAPMLTLMVERFVEKADEATTRQCLAECSCFWKAGMFVLKASVWLKAIEGFRPDISASTRTAWGLRVTDAAFVWPGKGEFDAIPSGCIDCACTGCCQVNCFPIRMASQDAVWSVLPKDGQCSAQLGDVLVTDRRDSGVRH